MGRDGKFYFAKIRERRIRNLSKRASASSRPTRWIRSNIGTPGARLRSYRDDGREGRASGVEARVTPALRTAKLELSIHRIDCPETFIGGVTEALGSEGADDQVVITARAGFAWNVESRLGTDRVRVSFSPTRKNGSAEHNLSRWDAWQGTISQRKAARLWTSPGPRRLIRCQLQDAASCLCGRVQNNEGMGSGENARDVTWMKRG